MTDSGSVPSTGPAAVASTRRRRLRLGVASERPSTLATILLGVAVVIILAAAITNALGMWRAVVVLSGSMSPTFDAGDVVVATSEPVSSVSVGQVLIFHPPDGSMPVAHRVVETAAVAGDVSIRTKGDANNAPDQWNATLIGDTAWVVRRDVPQLGYAVQWFAYPPVRLGFIALVVVLILWMGLQWVWKSESDPLSHDGGDTREI